MWAPAAGPAGGALDAAAAVRADGAGGAVRAHVGPLIADAGATGLEGPSAARHATTHAAAAARDARLSGRAAFAASAQRVPGLRAVLAVMLASGARFAGAAIGGWGAWGRHALVLACGARQALDALRSPGFLRKPACGAGFAVLALVDPVAVSVCDLDVVAGVAGQDAAVITTSAQRSNAARGITGAFTLAAVGARAAMPTVQTSATCKTGRAPRVCRGCACNWRGTIALVREQARWVSTTYGNNGGTCGVRMYKERRGWAYLCSACQRHWDDGPLGTCDRSSSAPHPRTSPRGSCRSRCALAMAGTCPADTPCKQMCLPGLGTCPQGTRCMRLASSGPRKFPPRRLCRRSARHRSGTGPPSRPRSLPRWWPP